MEISLATLATIGIVLLLLRWLRRTPTEREAAEAEASVRVATHLFEPDDFAADPRYTMAVESGAVHAEALQRQAATGPVDRIPILLVIVDDIVETWAPQGLVGRLNAEAAAVWHEPLARAAAWSEAPVAVWGRLTGGGSERPFRIDLAWPDHFDPPVAGAASLASDQEDP
jgi:hypothetical protein